MNTTVKTTRISNELSWMALKYRFYNLEMLSKAVADGTLASMVKACADTMYDGDMTEVISAMRRNLSSKATNSKKAASIPADSRDDKKRYEVLWNFTGELAKANKPVRGTADTTTRAKASWKFTADEIEAIAPDDYDTLKYVYDGMMSKKSKAPDAILKESTMEEFLSRLSMVSNKYSGAKKLAKKQVEISATLMAKLNKGKKATLTAEEFEEIKQALRK